MEWYKLKSKLLEKGSARLTGVPWNIIARSSAGPGAGGSGSVFFSYEGKRIRLSIDPESSIEVHHIGDGRAELIYENEVIEGTLEPAYLHCPRQAYITITAGCRYHCRYCNVPLFEPKRKSIEEIIKLVEGAREYVDAISLTSGVLYSPEEEEDYTCQVVENLSRFHLPIGVSIYPTKDSPKKLHLKGVAEVKWNLEAASESIFQKMCPDLDRELMWYVLRKSVPLFGRGNVFSNLIIGLGETDEELAVCIRTLTQMGVIPVLRPVNPIAELKGLTRPSSDKIIAAFKIHEDALKKAGLSPTLAKTMCSLCTGCDLVPGRDR